MEKEKSSSSEPKFRYLNTFGKIGLIFFTGFSLFILVSTIMIIILTKPKNEVRVPDVVGKRFNDAYNSLAYNIGTGAFCGSTLVKKSNAGDYAGACEEFLRWRYYQGHDCSLPQWKSLCGGIWSRRQWEYRLCLGEIK